MIMSSDHLLARLCGCKPHRLIQPRPELASTDYSQGQARAEVLCRNQQFLPETDLESGSLHHSHPQPHEPQVNRERLLSGIAQRIRQSLDLDEILITTVTEIQQFLQADRVLVYRLWPDGSGSAVTEAVVPGWPVILHRTFPQEVFPAEFQQHYSQGHMRAIADVEQAEISPCLVEFLQQFAVKAKLIVPILQGSSLWGLLIAHQCQQPRQWQAAEIDLMQQLATQVAIAIQQAQLYQQVRDLNANLEAQVQERTAQLKQALDFEATLKRITDKVRDSLDEHQILQTVVQELGQTLDVSSCNTALYGDDLSLLKASYEYTHPDLQISELILPFGQFPQIYQQLQQGECFQLCTQIPQTQTWATLLLCSIFDNDRALGDLLLLNRKEQSFNELELRLVQQVANQCAIAIRQARLHQAAQSQVRELEKLNQLKDDFLSTVSHELRSPVCNMKMALQMLAVANPEPSDRFSRYLNILDDECDREINLINDLLDLQRLEAGTQPSESGAIELSIWLDHLAEPFQERARQRQQALKLQIPSKLPLLISDPYNLERVITELLNNACKYTPPGESITLAAKAESGIIQLKICNSGIEIPKVELSRIFDKFYRVPNADRWKQGGTGLGLALVRKLTELLGGRVWVESGCGQTCFTVELPIRNRTVTVSSLCSVNFSESFSNDFSSDFSEPD